MLGSRLLGDGKRLLRRIRRIVDALLESWRVEEEEPGFWAIFTTIATISSAFLAGYLTTPARIIPAAFVALGLGIAIWRYRVMRHRNELQSSRGWEGFWLVLPIIVIAGVVLVELCPSAGTRTAKPPIGGAPPVGAPGERIIPSYDEFPKGPNSDIDVRLGNGGFVAQVFTARSSAIKSITFIASREFHQGDSFTEQDIGSVRLELLDVDSGGGLQSDVPIALFDADSPPSAAGVTLHAGPNHKNTTVKLRPIAVKVGHLYAFKVTNASGATMSFSLCPYGERGHPSYLFRYESPDGALNFVQKRIERLVTGSVCNVYEAC